jgi:type 1 fimbria pilin
MVMRILLTIAMLVFPFSNALAFPGTLTFSGEIINPPCSKIVTSEYEGNDKKNKCPPFKKEKKNLYKVNQHKQKKLVGEILVITYI